MYPGRNFQPAYMTFISSEGIQKGSFVFFEIVQKKKKIPSTNVLVSLMLSRNRILPPSLPRAGKSISRSGKFSFNTFYYRLILSSRVFFVGSCFCSQAESPWVALRLCYLIFLIVLISLFISSVILEGRSSLSLALLI